MNNNIKSIKKSPLLMSFIFTIVIFLVVYLIKNGQEAYLEYKRTEKLKDLEINEIGYQEELPEYNKAFYMLENLLLKVQKFLQILGNMHPDNKDVKRLISRMKKVEIQESPNEKDVSSYTIDKGQLISICLRNKNDLTNFHDENTMWFVICHELAHVMSVTEGHNSEFIKNFKFLLTESANYNMYNPVDYRKNNITYCGVKVTNNPYFN